MIHFGLDETILVTAQNIRRKSSAIIVDSLIEKDIEFEGETTHQLLDILKHGHLLTVKALLDRLGRNFSVTKEDSIAMLTALFSLNLISTNRLIGLSIEKIAMNPSAVALGPRTAEDIYPLLIESTAPGHIQPRGPQTAITQLVSTRSSTRVFAGREIDQSFADSLLWVARGEGAGIVSAFNVKWHHRTVPSAGGLYPCSVYMLARTGQDYRLITPDSTWETARTVTNRQIKKLFPKGGSCPPLVFIIGANYERPTKKYGSRGWRYAILEVGHIAQNILLHAQELDLATCEVGGFLEEPCGKLLGLKPTEIPLVVIFCGHHADKKATDNAADNKITKVYGGMGGIVPEISIHTRDCNFHPNRFYAEGYAAMPAQNRGGPDSSVMPVAADGTTREDAITKATAEGVERYLAGYPVAPKTQTTALKLGVDKYLDPHLLQRYTKDQGLPTDLARFNKKEIYRWYDVEQWGSSNRRMVPGDFIFYPYHSNHAKPLAYASSNGMAAFTDQSTAIWRAAAELLERESLLIWWFSRYRPARLSTEYIGDDIQRLIKAWSRHGVEIRVLNITTSIPAVCAVAIDKRNGHKASYVGLAARMTHTEAARHAVSEVTRSVVLAEKQEKKKVRPRDVQSVLDHHHCFASGYAFEYMQWWSNAEIRGVESSTFPRSTSVEEWNNWISCNVGPIWYYKFSLPQHLFPEQPLAVVRTLIPGVTSVQFGFGMQDFGLSRLRRQLQLCSKFGESRHRFVPLIHPLA